LRQAAANRILTHCGAGLTKTAGCGRLKPVPEAIAMPLDLERMPWMPSPSLVPNVGPIEPSIDLPIDFLHLGRMTLGEAGLERQVLTIFLSQTESVMAAIAGLTEDAADLAHKLKGSARAIGACRMAVAADRLETILRAGRDPTRALAELAEAAAEARSAIAARLGPC
jgi:HPt (histidine-containing phosphotransfer) domain-containing protein